MMLAVYAALLILSLAEVGCKDAGKPPFVESQYDVLYLSTTHTRQRVGDLSTDLGSGDLYGYCNARKSGGTYAISVLVADSATWPTPAWKVRFQGIQWPEDSTTSVTCDHVEIFDERTGSDDIPCAGGDAGTCQVTVSRNEDLKDTVQIWFSCNEFDTNVSTGGVPNTMSIRSGAMQIQNCDGF
jgi:hypothetical protein